MPDIATGRWTMACMPRMADCGRLIMGIERRDPNTPPLLSVKVPPCMSAGVSRPVVRTEVL